MSRWLTILPLVVLIALGALFGLYALNRDPQVQPDAMVGKPAPSMVLPTLEGGAPVSIRAAASEGPVLVNFFASWCAPCEIEHPVIMGLKGRGVRVVGINYEDVPPRGSPEKARAMLARLGNPYAEVLADAEGRAGIEFGLTGVPETFVVAQDGTIVAKHTGPLDEAEAARLAKLVR
jgi:cytochrome c biogenesis protein CcmG, thiol:disulfide interchange protein DsbE